MFRQKAQLQMLMHMSGKKTSYFCVASPQFEQDKNVNKQRVEYDSQYCKNLTSACKNFWSNFFMNLSNQMSR